MGFFFYIDKKFTDEFLKMSFILCEECYNKDIKTNKDKTLMNIENNEEKKPEERKFNNENFEFTSIFNLLNPQENSKF